MAKIGPKWGKKGQSGGGLPYPNSCYNATLMKTPAKRDQRWPAHLAVRLANFRKSFAALGIDACLVTNPRDIRYLTGMLIEDSWMVVGRQDHLILTDSRFDELLVRDHGYLNHILRKNQPLALVLGEHLKKLKIKRLGLQADHLTVMQRGVIAKSVGAGGLVNTEAVLLNQRSYKDEVEIKTIRKAVKIQQEAFQATVEQIRIGMTEQRVAAILEFEMRVAGAESTGFPSIVAVGANASLPHAVPGKTKVKVGQVLLIDWGACVDGYRSDMTRTLGIGKLSGQMREVYQVVLAAQLAGIAAIKPGAELAAVDAAARKVIVDAGYGERFGHGLGHGIGLDIHENPRLSSIAKGKLEPGQIVTVEPGIYLPGVGGVRIEDDVLVTKGGRAELCGLPKALDWAIIPATA